MLSIRKLLLIIILGCMWMQPCRLQESDQKKQLLLYNTSLGAVVGGVGAFINTPSGKNRFTSFFKGAGLGLIGGLIVFQAKSLTINLREEQNYWMGVPIGILHSSGVSIVDNTARNKKPWAEFSHTFLTFRFTFFAQKKIPLIRLAPTSLALAGFASTKGKFNLLKSLQFGIPYFESRQLIDDVSLGKSYANSIVIYKNSLNDNITAAHEFLHVLQYQEYLGLNAWLRKPAQPLTRIPLIKKLSRFVYPEIPYFSVFYHIQGRQSLNCQFKNFYEFEAQYFALKNYINRCQ